MFCIGNFLSSYKNVERVVLLKNLEYIWVVFVLLLSNNSSPFQSSVLRNNFYLFEKNILVDMTNRYISKRHPYLMTNYLKFVSYQIVIYVFNYNQDPPSKLTFA